MESVQLFLSECTHEMSLVVSGGRTKLEADHHCNEKVCDLHFNRKKAFSQTSLKLC